MARLAVEIDSRPAKRGARIVKRDLDDIKRRARDVERGTGRMGRTAGQSFDRMARGSRVAERRLSALTTIAQRAQGVFATFLGVAAVRGFISSLQQTVTELDKVAKAADRLGVGVEALQELRFAAEQSGIAVNTFDMGLQRFVRRTAEAAQGTGEAKDALEQLDIQLRTSTGALRPAEDLLMDVADALAGVEDQGARVRLGFKLFDSEGVAMINMLQRGSERMRAMRGEARALGIVLSEDLVRDAERMKDEMGRQFAALDSLWSKFVIRFLRGADRLFGFVPPTIEEQLRERVNELREIQDTLARRSQGFGLENFLAGPTGNLEKRQQQLLQEIRTLEDLRRAQEGVNRTLREAESIGGLGAPGGAVSPRAESVSRVADAMERVKTTADEMRETGARAFEGIGDAAERAAEQTRLVWRNMTGGFIRDLRSGLEQGKSLWRSFGDAVMNVINRITDALINQLLDAIFRVNGAGGGGGILGTLLGGLLGGGSAGSIAPSGASFLGGGVGRVPIGFQHGGSFTVGGAGGADRNLVAFRATRGERVDITPAGQSGERGGGTVVNVYAPPGSEVREERRESGGMEQVDIYIENTVARSMSRPGSPVNRVLSQMGARSPLTRR